MTADFALKKHTSQPAVELTDDLRNKRMWESVPPEVFEHAPSTVGLFERVEAEIMAELLAKRIILEGAALHLLGCGTAMREVDALRNARGIEIERLIKAQSGISALSACSGFPGPMFVVPRLEGLASIIGYDFAAQFLEVADRRLSEFTQLGLSREYRTVLASLDKVQLGVRQNGLALLGVYDVNCLLEKSKDGLEAVGLEEYGFGMREILGANIQISPLVVRGEQLVDLSTNIRFRSDDPEFATGFQSIRDTLVEMKKNTVGFAGYRVRIQKPEFEQSGELAETCFTSTWFDLPQIVTFMKVAHRMDAEIVRGNTAKGAVLVLGDAGRQQVKVSNCALMMNNVLGNLGSHATLNAVLKTLSNFVRA